MVNSYPQQKNKHSRNARCNEDNPGSSQSKRLAQASAELINQLYSPIDAINRFINLALQGMGEDSQSRQFLIESKKGVRKTSVILKRLNNVAKRIEQEASRLEMEAVND